MPRITGSYTSRRDGHTYTYEATWQEAGEGVIWTASITRAQQVIGSPTGQIRTTAGFNVADEIRRLVEEAIERTPRRK